MRLGHLRPATRLPSHLQCAEFYAASELKRADSPKHGTAAELTEEENWFFRLSAYQGYLEGLICSGAVAVTPEPFRNEVLAFVRAGLKDPSVSLSAERARG